MIIDFHTHTFPDKIAGRAVSSLQGKSHTVAFSDGTADGLVERDREAGINLAVILPVATSSEQVRGINDKAAELNQKYSKALAGCRSDSGTSMLLSLGCIHPEMDDTGAELRRIKALGLRGIKIHPVYQGMDIDSAPYIRILEESAELGLIVVTHGGWDIGYPGADECLPDKIRRAVKAADPEGKTLKFVAAHMGGWRAWKDVPEQLADTGVYLDTSFSTGKFYPLDDGYYDGKDTDLMNTDEFMEIYRAFGADRILFGTDSPWSRAEESLRFIRSLPITEEEKKMVLGGNAEKLLGI